MSTSFGHLRCLEIKSLRGLPLKEADPSIRHIVIDQAFLPSVIV